MTTAVMYGKHRPAKPETSCLICSQTSPDPVVDHCHRHGLVRGDLCRKCNWLMGRIDRLSIPANIKVLITDVLAHSARCPECPALTEEDLTMTARPERRQMIKTTPPTEDRLRDRTRRLNAALDANLTHDEVLNGLLALAEQHPAELVELIRSNRA